MSVRLRFLIVLLLVLLATTAVQVLAQADEAPNPDATLSWPPPVYVLRGESSIRGTANLPGMVSYFLEYRELNDDLTSQGEDIPWTALTLPAAQPVIDDVLAVWDTTEVPDGLYELRLSALTSAQRVLSTVRPLRIENEPPPFVIIETPVGVPGVVETQEPAPPVSGDAQATARVNANVRTGDSTGYPVISSLQPGQTVAVIGVSSTGSGWWAIRLPDGREGWVAPSTVDVTGNTAGLPRFAPPPVPATPIPPTATGAPLPDATISNVRFDRPLVQGQPFQFIVTVFNASGRPLPEISVACNFTPQNQLFSTTLSGLAGNSQIDVAVTAQLSSGGGSNTTANCAVDVNNVVAELNESNNFFNLTAGLAMP